MQEKGIYGFGGYIPESYSLVPQKLFPQSVQLDFDQIIGYVLIG